MGPGRRLLVSVVCPGWARLPQPGPAALPENSATSVLSPGPGGPEVEDSRRGKGDRLGGCSGPPRPLLPSLPAPAASGHWPGHHGPGARSHRSSGRPTPAGVMASSSGGGSTCPAWNGSDGRNFGGRDAPLPGRLGGSWVGGGWDEPQKHRGKWGEGQPLFHGPTRPWPLPMRQGWDKESQTASAVSQSLSP